MNDVNESPEELLQRLYEVRMQMFRAECERVFGPLADFVKDQDIKGDVIFAA